MATGVRIAKNTIFLYFRMLFVLLIGLYVSRVILHNLGIVDFGLYNVIGGIVTMLTFLNGTAAGATSRFLTYSLAARDKKNYDYRELFSTAFFIHLALAVLIVVIAETAGMWYFYNYLVIPPERVAAGLWVFQISIFTCLISFTQVPYNASIIAHEHMNIYAFVGVFEAIANLAIAYAISISPVDKMIFYALLMFIKTVMVSVFYRIYCIRNFGDKCRVKIVYNKKMLQSLLQYSGWDLVGNFGAIARGQGVNIILNAFFGPAVNAARAITSQVENGLNQFTSNFQTAARPAIVKRYAEGDVSGMLNLLYETCKFSVLLYSILAIPILLETDSVLSFWLVNIPEDTAIFIQLVILTFFASSVNSAIGIGVHATGDVKRLNIYAGSKIFIELPAIICFLYLGYPAYSAFAIMMISSMLIMWVDLYVLKLNIPEVKAIEFIKRVIFPVIYTLALPIGISYSIHILLPIDIPFIRLIVISGLYWCVLILAVWTWGLNTESRDFVRKKIRDKLGRK